MSNIILWGTGNFAAAAFDVLKEDIVYVIDNDENKWGSIWNDFEIKPPIILSEINLSYDKIIIAAMEWRTVRLQIIEQFGIEQNKIDNIYYKQREQFLKYYNTIANLDDEKRRYIEYIKKYPLDGFNDNFVYNYLKIKGEVFWDDNYKLYYVIYNKKKMYLKRKYNTIEKVRRYYTSLLLEQDEQSPHRYLTNKFQLDKGSIVLDAGVAEGNFALDVIDLVDKIYLVEADSEWIEVLKYTFAPYMDKVEIIHGYLGDKEGEISIDSIIGEGRLDFLKMDIEGAELSALKGARKVLDRENVKIDICTYHRENDYQDISTELDKYKYVYWPSSGYMVFITPANYKDIDKPKLVRGLIQGSKKR